MQTARESLSLKGGTQYVRKAVEIWVFQAGWRTTHEDLSCAARILARRDGLAQRARLGKGGAQRAFPMNGATASLAYDVLLASDMTGEVVCAGASRMFSGGASVERRSKGVAVASSRL